MGIVVYSGHIACNKLRLADQMHSFIVITMLFLYWIWLFVAGAGQPQLGTVSHTIPSRRALWALKVLRYEWHQFTNGCCLFTQYRELKKRIWSGVVCATNKTRCLRLAPPSTLMLVVCAHYVWAIHFINRITFTIQSFENDDIHSNTAHTIFVLQW